MINQFSDLSPINRPMNPMQAAAGIVNALSFFNTAPGSNSILPDLVQNDQKLTLNLVVIPQVIQYY